MTFHPPGGGRSSSEWFHADDWLDFNTMQTGPRRDGPNFQRIAADYALAPAKPCLDGEPGYERAHPRLPEPKLGNPRLTDHEVRRYAYGSLFAGAFGHTYGCLEVWQFFDPAKGHEARNGAALAWPEALDLPGARQMVHARRLLESRPFLTRLPDQSLIVGDAGGPRDRLQATRDADGSYALVYTAGGRPITLDTAGLAGERLAVWWFDPRTGRSSAAGEVPNRRAPQEFVPPGGVPSGTPSGAPGGAPEESAGRDWVLVLDDVAQGFAAPGTLGAQTASEG